MTALPAGVRAPRDRIVSIPYNCEGDAVTVGETFSAGWLLARDASAGTLQLITEEVGLLPGGFATKDFETASVSGDYCEANTGVFAIDQSTLTGDAFTGISRPAPAYGVDNNTIGKLPVNPSTGAARSIVGLFLRVDRPLVGDKAIVWVGPEGVAMAEALLAAQAATTRDVCRGVFTAIDSGTTYSAGLLTGPADTAISSQDGLTVAVGDIFFARKGQANLPAAAQAGPWQILSLGSGSSQWVACRPWWYATGSTVPVGYKLEIGPSGTGATPQLANTEWKAFASVVVDTGDPLFWPKRQSGSYTAASGVVLNAVSTFAIRSTTLSSIKATNQGTAAHASTVGPPRVSAVTAGAIGTSALTMVAESAPGTTNTSDVGVYTVEVTNW